MNKRLIRKLSTLLCVSMVATNVPVFAQLAFRGTEDLAVVDTPQVTTGPAIDVEPNIVHSVTIGKEEYPVSDGSYTEIETSQDSLILIFNASEGTRVLANGEDVTRGYVFSVKEGDNIVRFEAYDNSGTMTQSFSFNFVKQTIDSISTIREIRVGDKSYTDIGSNIESVTYDNNVRIKVYTDSAKSKVAFFDDDFFNTEGYGEIDLAVTEDVMEVPIRCLSYDGTSETEYLLTIIKGQEEGNTRIKFMGFKPTDSDMDYIRTLGGRYEEGQNYYLINTPADKVNFTVNPEGVNTKAYLDGEEITGIECTLDLAVGDNEKELKLVAENGDEEIWTINFNHYDFSEECGIVSVYADDSKLDGFNFDHGSKGHIYFDSMNKPFYTITVNTINPDSTVFINGVGGKELKVDTRQDVTTVEVEVVSPSGIKQKIHYDLRKDGRLINSLLDLAEFEKGELDRPFNMYEFDYTVTMPSGGESVLAKFSPYFDNSKVKIEEEWVEDSVPLSIPIYDGKVLAVKGLGYDGGESTYTFTFKVEDKEQEEQEPSRPEQEEQEEEQEQEPSRPEPEDNIIEESTPVASHWKNRIAYSVEYKFLTELIEGDEQFKSFSYEYLGNNVFKVTVTLHDGQSFSFQVKQQDYSKSILNVPQVKTWAQESTNYVYANNLFDDHSNKSNIVQELDIIKGLDLAFVTAQNYMLSESRDFYGYDKFVEGDSRYMPHVANMASFLRDYTKFYSIDENMFTVESMSRRDLADIVACMLWEFKVETEEKEFPFTDVEPTDEIKKVYDAEIMIGRTPTEFCPDEEVTFAELMMVLARLHKSTLQ